ncbi:MAG: FAD-binding protein [Proteobacteria bacterium]|nr:FAD-binding protein [Pseudomonadota bacterium]MBU1056752.1 FAD-binding protein [Pseudomonadota bacterium]
MTNRHANNNISRRDFMALAGGAAGIATLAAVGVPTGWAANKSKVNVGTMNLQDSSTDVLVIGGGMAGLFAAVKAHDAGAKVTLVSKGRLGSSGQTPFAKGIFAYDASKEKVSLDEFVETVSRSALGTNNPAYTRQMAEHSLARVNELREWGFFDSPLYNNCFNKPIKERDISVLERIVITHLIKENGRIAGAAGFSLDEEKTHILQAKSVILCTGAGGFKPNGFPICDLTHDGTVMAYNIGAKVTGKEWNDGHPGQSTNAAACFDGWHGMFERKPGTTGVEVHHDLGVDLNYIAYMAGGPLAGGPPGMGSNKRLAGGPYTPTEFDRSSSGNGDGARPGPPPNHGGGPPKEGGGPPGMSGSPVGGSSAGMAIHKSEGLVPINDKCESTIPGLYAAGDALGSYMAGAIYTQVGSSLAGSAVQGAIAADAAAEYCKRIDIKGVSKKRIKEIQEEILAPLKREAGYSPAWVTQTLQGVMIPNFIIYIKKENLLKAALAYIEELRDHHMPMLRAADMHELRLAYETRNMIISAEMKLKASIMRKESRCSHYRLDYPDLDDKNWQAWINIFKGPDGSMKLEKQPFGSWPVV